MDIAVKQRLIGAAVLAALAMIFLPMLLQSPDVQNSDASEVPLTMPAAPDQKFETRELTLPVPAPASGNGVLGDVERPVDVDPNAVVTVETADVAPRDVMPEAPVDMPADAPTVPVDAATGQPMASAPPSQAPSAPAPTPASTPAIASTPAPSPPLDDKPLPPATAAGDFAVSVGSFSNEANARALEAKLRAGGLPVRSDRVDVAGKPALRLRVGPYAERAAAEAARLRVQALSGTSGQVITLDAVGTASVSNSAATKPVAASVGFAVQLGALRLESDAIALRDRVRAAGFVAFHQRVTTDNGVLFRVRVGPVADRSAADALRVSLAAKLGVTGVVVSHP